jgi:acetate kinase
MMTKSILVINAGSSSVKFQVFAYQEDLPLLAHGKVYNLGTAPQFTACNQARTEMTFQQTLAKESNHEQALKIILDWLKQPEQHFQLHAVAHRVVHGGVWFKESVLIQDDVMTKLKSLNALAPLHQPHNLAAIEIIQRIDPALPQIACFDTAFHSTHHALFTEYALPAHLRQRGIRRYGFHGLSFEWIAHCLQEQHPNLASGRVIAAHLGNGASLCAMHQSISVDTTMGLTALDGLPMGTRSGSLDPGAIIYMIRELGMSPGDVEDVLYNQSGLLGLSGLSNDVKYLQEHLNDETQFALDFFSLKTAQFMGMMAIALGGIDAIIFTGGIGENSVMVRDKILERVECLKPFQTLVIPANEEKMMAIHTLALLNTQ